MKLRKLAVLSAAAVLAGGIVSCGSKDDNAGKDSRLSGTFCAIEPYNGRSMSENMSLDEYLDSSRDSYESLDFKELVFDGDSFEMSDKQSFAIRKKTTVYGGSYEVSDGKILFEYQTTTIETGEEKKVYNLADGQPHYDQGIINHEKNASYEEWQAEMDKMIAAFCIAQMEAFNKTGTFYTYAGNRIDFNDKYIDYNILPMVVQNVIGTVKPEDIPVYLYPVDDLICVPAYGTELDGSYSYGQDFTIVYNALDTFLEDEYSRYYTSKNDALKNDLKTNIEKQLGSTDDTRIEFSGGKWKWYNSEGSLINDGIYKESEEYKGLIALFVTEESANPDGTAVSMSPEFLYLDSGRKIWVPYMMKAD